MTDGGSDRRGGLAERRLNRLLLAVVSSFTFKSFFANASGGEPRQLSTCARSRERPRSEQIPPSLFPRTPGPW